MANPNHDNLGRFSSGSAATGDHQASASRPQSPRLPVKRHGAATVGTEKPPKFPRPFGPGRPEKGQAARDLIIRNKGIDQRSRGIPGDIGNRVGKMLPTDTGRRNLPSLPDTLRGKSGRGWPFNN